VRFAMPEDQFRQIVVKIARERQFGGTDQWCRDSVVARGDDSRRMLHAEVLVQPVAMIASSGWFARPASPTITVTRAHPECRHMTVDRLRTRS
jgi:hypothetical protein